MPLPTRTRCPIKPQNRPPIELTNAMITSDHTRWCRSDREVKLTAIFADAGIATSEALLGLLAALYRERPDNLAHALRVAHIAVRIATELGLDDRLVATIERAAWVHDLGKLVLPERDDLDDRRMTAADVERWSEQLNAVCAILDAAPSLRPAAALVIASRECMDGTGFPHRLYGQAIPIGARILHVADTYDALQELCAVLGMPVGSVNVELARHAGTRFDSTVVDAWLRLVDEQSMHALPRPAASGGSPVS